MQRQFLGAVAGDPIYDNAWQQWINELRLRIGMVDFADMSEGGWGSKKSGGTTPCNAEI